MSLWERLIAHPGFERIKPLYNDQFPLEVRFVCALWIEERVKVDQFIDINDPQIEQRAGNFLHSLIQQLEQEKQKLKRPEELPIKYRLEEAIRTFTQNLYNPFPTYKQIRDAIIAEQQFLDNFSESVQSNFVVDSEQMHINEKLKQMHDATVANNEQFNRYKHDLEQYKMLDYAESTKHLQINNPHGQPELEERRAALQDEFSRKKQTMQDSINIRGLDLYRTIGQIIVDVDETQKRVILKRLGKWQRNQALAGNGAPLSTSGLDEIQMWFEKLAELIWSTRNLIEKFRVINFNYKINLGDVIDMAYKDVTTLLQNLIVSGFIVEKQPPQVMKTNTR